MWTIVKCEETRDALVQEHRAGRDRLKQRFEADKLGDADIQF